MAVQFWMRDERLEDVIMNGSFLHTSEIGPVCDEVCVCTKILRGAAPRIPIRTAIHIRHDFQIIAEENLEDPCTEAALKPGVARSKDTVKLYVAGETNGQVGSCVDEFTVIRVYRTRRFVVQDRIQNNVGGDSVISSSNIEPKAIKGERLFVILVE